MTTLTEQLREALAGLRTYQAGTTGDRQTTEEVLKLIPALLDEHERLEREANDFAHGADELGDKPHRFFSDLLKLVEKYHPDYTFAIQSITKWGDAVGKGMNPDNFERLERESEAGKALVKTLEMVSIRDGSLRRPCCDEDSWAKGFDTYDTAFQRHRVSILSAYRSACEGEKQYETPLPYIRTQVAH